MAEREPGVVLLDTDGVRRNMPWGCGHHISRRFIGSKGMLDALCGLVCGLEREPCGHHWCALLCVQRRGQNPPPMWAAELRARVWQLWVQILPQPLLPGRVAESS